MSHNHHAFDQAVRQRAAREQMNLKPEAEARFERGLARARAQQAAEPRRKRNWAWKLSIAVALQCAVVLGLLWFFPSEDRVRGVLPMDAPQLVSSGITSLAQSKPAPQAQVDAVYTREGFQVEGRFESHADDIWLVEWSAHTSDRSTGDLLWLEPGASCVQRTVWQGLPPRVEMSWQYRAYRVTADVLHWVDDGAEAEDQQQLMEDAFQTGALLLLAGDWENGAAGPMRLLLPDSYRQEHPDVTPLAYYLQQGMLQADDGLCSAQGTAVCVRAD